MVFSLVLERLEVFLGSLCPGFLAVKIGSENLLFATVPIYILLMFFYSELIARSGNVEIKLKKDEGIKNFFLQGYSLIKDSKHLVFILMLVICMQVTATLTDFEFNMLLEEKIPEKDLRTAFFGKLLGLGNILTMSFQFVGTYILIHFLGLHRSHLFVPVILCANTLLFLVFPVFGLITFSFLLIKCFDFSVFGVIKEMLYIPLKVEEKFQAKAFIDVFVHRGAKAFASFFILFLQFAFASGLISFLTVANLCLFLYWLTLVYFRKESYKGFSLDTAEL